jgi:hypothetical protein
MSTYGFKNWLQYWWWRFMNRKRRIEIREAPHWDYWNGKRLLMAIIDVGAYKNPYHNLKRRY